MSRRKTERFYAHLFERQLEMKIADIEIFKNANGTVSMRNTGSFDDSLLAFPIEIIPSITEALLIVYNQNGGKSEIILDEEYSDE